MTTYCEIGQTARVTIHNGTTLDFDAPVEITPLQPLQYDITFTYDEWGDGRITTTTGRIWGNYVEWRTVQRYWWYYWGRTYREPSGEGIEVWCRGNVSFSPTSPNNYGWHLVVGGAWKKELINLQSLVLVPGQISQGIIIKNLQGTELYRDSLTSFPPSVECVQPCPPGTLDCGDCCLSCDDIFNQISGIRSLLSRIK